MTTIRAYTTIEQSKKLAEFLPLESADMWWSRCTIAIFGDNKLIVSYSAEPCNISQFKNTDEDIPCWSLAALLDVLPFHLIVNNQRYAFSMHKGLDKDGETYMLRYNVFNTDVCLCLTDHYNSTVDACYEMIIKLHEQKLL